MTSFSGKKESLTHQNSRRRRRRHNISPMHPHSLTTSITRNRKETTNNLHSLTASWEKNKSFYLAHCSKQRQKQSR
jgi:hypothetical protein